jgi:predicted DNA-binding protein
MHRCMPACYGVAMKRTALFLKERQLQRLQLLCDRTGAPVAELVRRAIDLYLEKTEKEEEEYRGLVALKKNR